MEEFESDNKQRQVQEVVRTSSEEEEEEEEEEKKEREKEESEPLDAEEKSYVEPESPSEKTEPEEIPLSTENIPTYGDVFSDGMLRCMEELDAERIASLPEEKFPALKRVIKKEYLISDEEVQFVLNYKLKKIRMNFESSPRRTLSQILTRENNEVLEGNDQEEVDTYDQDSQSDGNESKDTLEEEQSHDSNDKENKDLNVGIRDHESNSSNESNNSNEPIQTVDTEDPKQELAGNEDNNRMSSIATTTPQENHVDNSNRDLDRESNISPSIGEGTSMELSSSSSPSPSPSSSSACDSIVVVQTNLDPMIDDGNNQTNSEANTDPNVKENAGTLSLEITDRTPENNLLPTRSEDLEPKRPAEEEPKVRKMTSRHLTNPKSMNRKFRSVNMRENVSVPKGYNKNDWIAEHVEIFTDQAEVVYRMVVQSCLCTEMTAGPNFTYLWADGVKVKNPLACTAKDYINYLFEWIRDLVRDENLFAPKQSNKEYPKRFLSVCTNIFKRLFRVYAHIYLHHFSLIESANAEQELNSSFKWFYYFVAGHKLVDEREFEPLSEMISTFK